MTPLTNVTLKNGGKPVLVAVLAHPDDETFGTGGTLALYARRGVEVYLVCATRGEVGDVDPALMRGFATVADRRADELRCAAEKLGLKGVFFLGYRDSGMPGSPDNQHPKALAATPLDQAAADVTHYLRKLRPQVVLTFDPIGGYRHPDHIAIHLAAVRAFYAAGHPEEFPDLEDLPAFAPQKLYFSTMPRSFLRIAVFIFRLLGRDPRRFGRNGDIDLAAIASENFPTHARIDFRPVAAIRDDAAACHASQGGQAMNKGIQGFITRLFRRTENYMRAFPEPRAGERIEKDLFAGVE
jgi:N-acetyl-1-D-myo-inositol-2-amino-2-deoxy-alpha-D-glucopyranoside deacetylase